MNIHYLEHKEINLSKWDKSIEKSINGNIYGFSWFLDIASYKWDALVADDYRLVMPVSGNTKSFNTMLIQPPILKQLGVYSQNLLNKDIVNQFIEAIPKKYLFYKITLNKYNQPDSYPEIRQEINKTFEIDLIRNYERIKKDYTIELRKKIKIANTNKVSVLPGLQPNDLINLYLSNSKAWKRSNNIRNANILRQLISFSLRYKMGTLYGAYTSGNNLCSAAFFMWSHNKVVMFFSAANNEGIANNSLYLIIDQFIKKYAENNLTLNFEVFEYSSIDLSYNDFGAKACEYFTLIKNNLPWYKKYLISNQLLNAF